MKIFGSDKQVIALLQQNISLSQQILAAVKIQGGILSTAALALAALQTQVTQNTTVEASAVTLIQGLAAQIAALAAQGTVDPAALTALSASLNSSATALAAAVTANTSAAPAA